MAKIVFIGGTGRCGTSILKEALALHSQAASLPFEHRFIVDPDGIADFYASACISWTPYVMDARLRRLGRFLRGLAHEPLSKHIMAQVARMLNLTPPQYPGWELARWLPNFEHHVDELVERLTDFVFPARWPSAPAWRRNPQMRHCYKEREELAKNLGMFIEAVINDLLKETGKQFFVEDNTWNILFAREIVDLLPDAKIVHIFRDPRDVVASFVHQQWCPHNPVQAAQWYNALMAHWFKVRGCLPAYSYREVSLERLVHDPMTVLHELCRFAEVDFDPAMLDIDLSRAHIGRWQHDFSPEEQVESIIGRWIERLGYDRSCDPSARACTNGN